ncbi:MAG: serine/threonine-protein kinase [Cyanobacteria bacterium P01_F01_bin.53]
MRAYCTRPNCSSPINYFNAPNSAKNSAKTGAKTSAKATTQSEQSTSEITTGERLQRYCSSCGMALFLGGRYLPESFLGQGGFGTAFLARDFHSPTQRRCVVKLLQPSSALTPEQVQTAQRLFATEARVLESFGWKHPRIPNLYAYFPLLVPNPFATNASESSPAGSPPSVQHADKLFYLVQEFIDGEDLQKLRRRQGKLPETEVTQILTDMLDVLAFVHENGAIHRDVKPSNIIKGKDGELSLLDFGAVKEVTSVTTPGYVTSGHTTICSKDYAPPEQLMHGIVNETSDLYALAATCVVLLTGKNSGDLRDSASNQWHWQRFADVSPQLCAVLDHMLQAQPRDRYSSASEVLTALNTPLVTQTRPALIEVLGSATFMGAESALLAIAASSLPIPTILSAALWLAMVAGIAGLQIKQPLMGKRMMTVSTLTLSLTLAAVLFVPALNATVGGAVGIILVTTMIAGCTAMVIAIIYRLSVST